MTKLITEVGPKLSERWPLKAALDDGLNLSLSITSDFVNITSDLYHQQHAWDEMHTCNRSHYSTLLITTNEAIAFRHLRAVEAQNHPRNSETPSLNYTADLISDKRGLISMYMAAMSNEHVEDNLKPPGFTLPSPDQVDITDEVWKAVAVNFSFGDCGLQVPGTYLPTHWYLSCQETTVVLGRRILFSIPNQA